MKIQHYGIGIIATLMLLSVVNATTVVISPTYSWNNVTNTLVISILPVNSQTLAYGQNITFVFNGITLSNTILNKSLGAQFNVGSGVITAPSNDFKQINKTYACVNGEHSVFDSQFNLSIICPPSIIVNKTFSPSNTALVGNILLLNNVTLNYVVNKQAQWNLSKTIVPSWISNTVVSNSTFNAIIMVNKIPSLNISKTLGLNTAYVNTTYGVDIKAAPFNSSLINYTDLSAWYSSNVKNDCIQTINVTMNGTTQSYCSVVKGQSNVSIYNICAGYDLSIHNLSQGLGQCIIAFHTLDVQNATNFHNQLTYAQNSLAVGSLAYQNVQLESQAQTDNTTISNLKEDITYGTEQSLGIYAVVALGLVTMGYLKKKRKDTSLNS